jgi:DTW domain-containing protein YfiP
MGDGPTVVPEAGPHAAWLYPSPDAIRLDEWKASIPSSETPTLVVPDGTWRQAGRARKRVAGLAALPCVTLPPGEPGRYRLRHASSSDRLATLEAIARAMSIMEDNPQLEDDLLQVFDTFVERMLAHRGKTPALTLSPAAPPPSADGL